MPPALSAIGPYASVASVMPSVDSMPTAASAMPYSPLVDSVNPPDSAYAAITQIAMMMIGTAVDSMPRLRPPMMIVADPVSDLSASFWVGLYVSDVKYSVKNPISTPASSPARIAK